VGGHSWRDELKVSWWGKVAAETAIEADELTMLWCVERPRLPRRVQPPPVVMNTRLFRAADSPLIRAKRFKDHNGAAHTESASGSKTAFLRTGWWESCGEKNRKCRADFSFEIK
jgi:hypothetical protein